MNNDIRRVIAYIIGKIILKKDSNTIYDHSSSSFKNIEGDVNESQINIFDKDLNRLFTGTGIKNNYSIYDYGSRKITEMKIDNLEFEGYDHESSKYFTGKVEDEEIIIYDFQDSKYHRYTVGIKLPSV